jgi:uncharacterized iron-regulated protein
VSRLIIHALLVLGASLALCGREPFASDSAAAPSPQEDFQATLRKLEKEIAAVRGLPFKSPVTAKIIARPKDVAKSTQGYYSIKDKTLYVYDDIAGAYERGVLIHEMVHALQDQHFGLAKLHQTGFNSDAELALAALIEGDATFTMIEMLKKDQPKVAGMLDVSLALAKDVERAFVYSQGARYVKALKDKGGWEAVNAAYRNPPRSTAAVLHPEGVKTIDLGFGTTRGELALIKLLAASPETAPEAVLAASGWKADRAVDNGNLGWWTIAFLSSDHALRFQSTLAKLYAVQNPQWKSFRDEPGANAWRDGAGKVSAVLVRGDRVLVLHAPDDTAFRDLSDRLHGPLPLRIYSTQDKRTISFGEMTDRLLDADVICIGESHDNDLHHRVQLQIIKAIHARDDRLGVGLEMFQRPFQAALDRYLRGETGEQEFLQATEYQQRWGYDWALYRPIVEFCRKNGLPVAALNASKELTGRISKVGHAGLTAGEKTQLGNIDFHVKEHRDYWFERLATLHGSSAGKTPPEQMERSYQVMTVWDGYMAASAAQFQQARHLRRLVVLAGSGHIDLGFGIPQRTAKLTGGKAATVHLEMGGEPDRVFANPVADFTVLIQQP